MLSSAQRFLLTVGLLGTLAAVGLGVYCAFHDDKVETRQLQRSEAIPFASPERMQPIPARLSALVHGYSAFALSPSLGPGGTGQRIGAAATLVKAVDSPQFFPGQPQPELVLVLSGQTYGYLQPCGCSRPQLGGLERRYELLNHLRARGWAVSAADLGDVAPKQIDEQGRIKYETAMQTYQDMGYAAVGMGLNEMAMPLDQALGIAQNYQPPFVLAANLNDKDGRFPEMYRGWVIHDPRLGQHDVPLGQDESMIIGQLAGLVAAPMGYPPLAAALEHRRNRIRVGYVGIVGETVRKEIQKRDPSLVFDPVEQVLRDPVEAAFAGRIDLLVLLFQGARSEARSLAERYPYFHVVVTLDESDEPSSEAETVNETVLISVGHKGRHVGLLAVTPQPLPELLPGFMGEWEYDWKNKFKLRYQLVPLTEHYELPDEETNLARERMKDYVVRIHRELSPGVTFLTKYPRSSHPLQVDFPEARYVGSAACKQCHPKAYETWSRSGHSHAYEGLVTYGRPFVLRGEKGAPAKIIGRQFDPDCVKCHTTGFEYRTGFVDEQKTPHLFGNGCENCHGPASLHVANPGNVEFSRPLRLSITTVENRCRHCHDGDNDPHFDLKTYWPKIKHGRE